MTKDVVITDNERKVLEYLCSQESDGGDYYYPFAPIIKHTGLDRRHVRLACRSLSRKGLAEYAKALTNDDGDFCGAGYCATDNGRQLIIIPTPQ